MTGKYFSFIKYLFSCKEVSQEPGGLLEPIAQVYYHIQLPFLSHQFHRVYSPKIKISDIICMVILVFSTLGKYWIYGMSQSDISIKTNFRRNIDIRIIQNWRYLRGLRFCLIILLQFGTFIWYKRWHSDPHHWLMGWQWKQKEHLTVPELISLWTKGPPYSRRNIQTLFLEWKYLNFKEYFIEICSFWSNWWYVSVGSDYDLPPSRRQAIIWTNADPVHRRIYVTLGGTSNNYWFVIFLGSAKWMENATLAIRIKNMNQSISISFCSGHASHLSVAVEYDSYHYGWRVIHV